MNKITKTKTKNLRFNEYLLRTRLKRVSQEILERFLGDFKDVTTIPKSKEKLAEEIVNYYKIMRDNVDFAEKFGNFVRDYVLSAGESEYLIDILDKETFVKWVNGWQDNTFIGRRFNFYKNIYLELGEKFLSLNTSEDGTENTEVVNHDVSNVQASKFLSFPSEAFLLVAYSQEKKSIFSKDQLLDVHETFEFEIILRKNSPLAGVRGNYRVVRDFFASAIEDINNSLSMIETVFIGDFDSKKSRPIAKPRKTINIEELRKALNGEYLDMDAPIPGDQATRIKFSFKGMRDTNEETHPIFGPAVVEAWKEQEKSRIGFRYNGRIHTFSVTSNGGLYFRQFAPEEVVTYVLLKISNL